MRDLKDLNKEIGSEIQATVNNLESLYKSRNVLQFRQALVMAINEWNEVFRLFELRPVDAPVMRQHKPLGDSPLLNAVYERDVALLFKKFKDALSTLNLQLSRGDDVEAGKYRAL